MRGKHYTELEEFPLYNWMKCQAGDISFTQIERGEEKPEDAEAFENLYDQYLKRYGHSKNYERLLEVMKKKAILELEYVQSRERFKLTEIAIQAQRLEDMIRTNGSGMGIEESLVPLSKYMGFRIDPKQTMVTEYYNILQNYGKANQVLGHSGE